MAWEEEEKYLENVVKEINTQINSLSTDLDKLTQTGTSLSYEDRLRGEHLNVNFRATRVFENRSKLVRALPSPYFGRVDFVEKGTDITSKIYLGKTSVMDKNNNTLVYDWRAPICSLYYEDGIGSCSFESPQGETKGKTTLKKSIIIENSKIKNVIDSSLLTQDELLVPYLVGSADDRLKSIVASIQSEQNKIIRGDLNNNLIIQGVAGSGKTTVALHRIAYLMYKYDNLNPEQFMIIGPNDYFMNYISDVLPDLDVDKIQQDTIISLLKKSCNEKINIINQAVSLEKIMNGQLNKNNAVKKSTLQYEKDLEEFINQRFLNLFSDPIVFEGIELLPGNHFAVDSYATHFGLADQIKKFEKMFSKYVKENASSIRLRIWNNVKDECLALPKDSLRRKEINDYMIDVGEKLKKGLPSVAKKYFSMNILKVLDVYKEFINSLENKNYSLDFINETNEVLNKNKVYFEDIPALMYIAYRLNGSDKFSDIKNVVIDEAQDFGEFQFDVLKKLFPNAKFNIYGDLNQSIYSYRGVSDWDLISNKIFPNKCDFTTLNKCYRATEEIVDLSNYILDELNCVKSQAVLRKGMDIDILKTNKDNFILTLFEKIKYYLDQNFKSIAIVTKDTNEAFEINTQLKKYKLNANLITTSDKEFHKGLTIVPSHLSKGLEFDVVILSDASLNKYDVNNEIDMRLLYVSSTRPLHCLSILYDGELTLPFRKYIEDKNLNKDFVRTRK